MKSGERYDKISSSFFLHFSCNYPGYFMYCSIRTTIIQGIRAVPVQVEVDISNGMPVFDMVGNLSSEVKEAKERVKTALHNCGIAMPAKRITVNLTPAHIRKSGTGFDLPLAVALLCGVGAIEAEAVKDIVFVGELNLKGEILPVKGILPIVYDEKNRGYDKFVIPWDNYNEASLISGAHISGVKDIEQVIDLLQGREIDKPPEIKKTEIRQKDLDFSQVNGQKFIKRACEVSASGMHNILVVGPPGAGKTMIAERMPSILPPLTYEEELEIAKIYSVCGMLDKDMAFSHVRPFRSPHNTITQAGLIGGGLGLKPGEISLAHNGVLFLDELSEFKKGLADLLRQPMEEKCIHLERGTKSVAYPSKFLFFGAMNPCNCGYYPDMQKCTCSMPTIQRYIERISQPLLDRIDICVEAQSLSYSDISENRENESSDSIRRRVVECHRIQADRYKGENFSYNSDIPAALLDKYCSLGSKERAYMAKMYDKMGMTARTYHRILRVARTIADMDKSDRISLKHISEAVCYRSIRDKYWGGSFYEV